MAAYRRAYDSHEPGSTPEPYATFTLLVTVWRGLDAGQSGGGLSTEMTVVIVVAIVLPVIVIASIVLIVIWVKKRRTTASGVNQPV